MNLSEKSLGFRFGRFLRRFALAKKGLAALEFAIVSPCMLTMYFGVTEVSDGFTASTKATAVASTAADLVAQEKVVCNSEMTDVFSALNAVMYPYPTGTMQVRISSLIDGGNNTVKVAWSDGHNVTALAVNTPVTVPAGLVATGGSVIMAEVTYNYSSPTGHMIYGVVPMIDKFYLHPRRVAQISRTVSTC